MSLVVIAVLVGAALLAAGLPHLLSARRGSGSTAASIWLLALSARALAVLWLALLATGYVPQTTAFETLAAWCWHAVVPLLTLQLELSGHDIADIAAMLPTLTVIASAAFAVAGFGRATWRLRRRLARAALARGPGGTVVVDAEDMLLAVPGAGPAEILVSRAALGRLDHEELAASLRHERAHLDRRHRPLLFLARVLAAVARPIPGTRAAADAFRLSLERDADEHAVTSPGDRLALASAICKAAGAPTLPATLPLSGQAAVCARLDALLEPPDRRSERPLRAFVAAQALVVSVLAASLAAWLTDAPAGEQAIAHLAALCAA